MTQRTFASFTSQAFILLSALALLSVSVMALQDPQQVMDLVQVKLTNNDAYSSIRGVYGGVGMTLVLLLCYWTWKDIRTGLVCLTLLWGLYAFSRILTLLMNGPLHAFGQQWLWIESMLFLVALGLLLLDVKSSAETV